MRPRWKLLVVAAVLSASASVTVPMTVSADQAIVVPGLRQPVTMTVDKWGVPHIFAANTSDLFLAQGFNAARDRLFQIDTWRRRGLGRLSEVLGPGYAEQDRAARLFLYRGDMAAEWASYGPEARSAATRFAAGINAYVDWLDRNPAALPEEFRQLGYRPARWNPEDVVRIRTHAIGNNLGSEVSRAKLVCSGGPDVSRYFRKLEPEHTARVPDGLDPCAIPDDVIQVYNLATAPVTFANGRMETLPERLKTLTGSNAWAVSPERTATGRPILAGDPHRENYMAPANRYIAHLSAPGLNIIGAGEPWNPGISMGHNGSIAFGLTNLPTDQTDLYVYELDPDDPTRYRYRDGWERMKTITEDVPVAGGSPRRTELSYTRHGPVVKIDGNRAYAVRTVWTQPGTSPYLGSLNFQRATNFGAFAHAMRVWKTPSSNLVYADTRGDIGWVPGAIIPRRTGYDGLLPVPGDGRYEWNGFHGALPLSYNPQTFVSANDYNFPPGHPALPGYEWAEDYRKKRIDEVLAQRPVTIQDTVTLQNDEKSRVATMLLPYLTKLSSTDPTTGKALALLRSYDGVTSKDSAAAALFETWLMRFLHPAWAHAVLPAPVADELVAASFDPDFRIVADSFAHPDGWFGRNGAAARDKLLLDTVTQAYQDVSSKLGADPGTWRWGAMHIHMFMHPLGGPNVGPVEKGGSFHTVRTSFYYYAVFPSAEVLGPTFKMALDVGAWDNSRAINAPGQSGDQRSPHYRDLAQSWTEGGTFPLLYGKEAIDKNARSTIQLKPHQENR
ncbi:penicillin acylase family protein [Kibdelosporangium persicum]|uniref:Penicillin g amidase n=1 Tax=Kibdelosporangium persicum TaxID=2698649 RepID=A0ABX2F6J3_9PSEU|nr:penicillin acylase family protein [Kibdelosporangium persicum]NRN66556.1 Penicillin g amidase [Kibdelosporangium persicum]